MMAVPTTLHNNKILVTTFSNNNQYHQQNDIQRATENAGVEKVAQSKTQGGKCKSEKRGTRMRGGKCGSGKCSTKTHLIL